MRNSIVQSVSLEDYSKLVDAIVQPTLDGGRLLSLIDYTFLEIKPDLMKLERLLIQRLCINSWLGFVFTPIICPYSKHILAKK